jgi:hypothetical protein
LSATNFLANGSAEKSHQYHEKRAVPLPAGVNRKLGRVSAQFSDTQPSLLLFFATLSPRKAASSYPTGNGRAQIRRRIAANTRRVKWPSANKSQIVPGVLHQPPAQAIDSPQRVVLDIDITEIPVYGNQEQSAYNCHRSAIRHLIRRSDANISADVPIASIGGANA